MGLTRDVPSRGTAPHRPGTDRQPRIPPRLGLGSPAPRRPAVPTRTAGCRCSSSDPTAVGGDVGCTPGSRNLAACPTDQTPPSRNRSLLAWSVAVLAAVLALLAWLFLLGGDQRGGGSESARPATPTGTAPRSDETSRTAPVAPRRPVRVLLAVDVSGSMHDRLPSGDRRIDAAKAWAAPAFVPPGQILKPSDDVGFWTFGRKSRIQPLQDLARARREHLENIKDALAGLPEPRGGHRSTTQSSPGSSGCDRVGGRGPRTRW